MSKHDSKPIWSQVCQWPHFQAFKTFLLQCKAEEMEFMFIFESSVAERLWRCSILSKWCFSYVLLLGGLGELAVPKQMFALLCTVQAAQVSLHSRRVVPKSSFECLLISWVDSEEDVNVYSARPSKLYRTFVLLSQATSED